MSAEEIPEEQVGSVFQGFLADVNGKQRLEVDVDGRRHTVELRPVYAFERDIVDRLIESSADTSVTGGAVPIKGEWIYGWLDTQFDDYINSIWKNYQFFVKYIEATTSMISNISTFNRSPGTYDSMYRYLLILEDLGLVERYRREEVPQSEYDFPVPPEFRLRTFVRLESDFESRKSAWNNPYNARYPDGEKSSESEEVAVQPAEPLEPRQGLEELAPDDDDGGEQSPQETDTGLDEFTGDTSEAQTEPVLPDDNASIVDFAQLDDIPALIDSSFQEALERTFDDAPIPTIQTEPEDFSFGRASVVGSWATGEATPGTTPLELVVSIDDSDADLSPGFVPPGMQQYLPDVMQRDNPYTDVFSSYSVTCSYDSAYKRYVEDVVRERQTELIYYSFRESELVEL